ncbi:MAG: hypothetical protein PHR81_09525, partial [Bacteroidales bacterium]|nr:hypothetical protein [Bacteroidales bacterium]
EKMNRYSGFLHEGTVDNYKVEAALLVDPDYPNISFYIFIKYTNERLDDVINILSSFAPII